jgi:UPF0755 protein
VSETVVETPAPPGQPRFRIRRSVALLVVLLLLAGIGYEGKQLYDSAFGVPDYDGTGSGSALVQVQPGDSSADIGATLLDKDVVKSAKAFTRAASKDARSLTVQPGYYQLRLRMSGASALALLLDPASRVRGRVTVPEGFPLSKVVDRLVRDTELKRANVVAALQNPAILGLPSWAKNRPEGFLFPATYDVEPGMGAVDALQLMTQKFSEVAAALDLEARAVELGLSPYQAVVVASLVEAETHLAADRPKVARVVLNRLAKGMPLQFDSTINYVRTERKARLSLQDLRVESPYNTYANRGLPPTPINAPGEASLEAALSPAAGDWLYFVVVAKDGTSLFTSDYQEFLRAKAKSQREGIY